jgi:hypothetical protein
MPGSGEFRKATYCAWNSRVEVAADDGTILVRDANGTVVRFTTDAWRKFTAERQLGAVRGLGLQDVR